MREPEHAYLAGAAGVAAATVASAAAGFASLWLLTQILPKEVFGGYAFTMAVIALASALATLGLDRSLLLRVARLTPHREKLRGGGLALRTVLVSGLAALLIAMLLALGARPLVGLGLFPQAQFWLDAIGIAVVPMTAAMMLQGWYQANHRVAVATAMPGISDLVRCLLFGAVFFFGLGQLGVATAVTLAASVPVVVLVWRAAGKTLTSPRLLIWSDITKGLQFVSLRLATQSTRQIDLIMMGLLASGGATAEYAVAVRLAALADYGRASLKPTFTPRARRWIAAGEHRSALNEYARARDASFAVALVAAAGFTLLGEPVLALFGPFEGAYAVLLLVTSSYVMSAGFGMHATYLSMHGEVGWSALLRVAGLMLLVGLNIVLIPRLGAVGAGLAAAGTQLLINVSSALLAWRLTGLLAVDRYQALLLLVSIAALWAAAFGHASPVISTALLCSALLAAAYRSRDLLRELARRALGHRPGRP